MRFRLASTVSSLLSSSRPTPQLSFITPITTTFNTLQSSTRLSSSSSSSSSTTSILPQSLQTLTVKHPSLTSTANWLNDYVLKLKLCPFAYRPLVSNSDEVKFVPYTFSSRTPFAVEFDELVMRIDNPKNIPFCTYMFK